MYFTQYTNSSSDLNSRCNVFRRLPEYSRHIHLGQRVRLRARQRPAQGQEGLRLRGRRTGARLHERTRPGAQPPRQARHG